MAYPILAPRDTWYTQGNSGIKRSTITEIHIKDSYTPAGAVTAQWDGSAAKDGSITVYVEGTVLTIAGNGSGKVQANADSKLIFCDSGHTDLYSSLESVSGLEYFDTTKVTDMTNAFTFCGKLSGLDWGAVDFPACKTFQGAFSGCALTSADLSGWNLGELENMNHAFSDCSNLVDVRLSKTMSNVTNWAACFNDCHSVEIIDISGVVSEKAIAMSQMFERCTNLKKVIGLGNLKTPVLGTAEQQKQTALSEFMRGCANLEEADLTNLDTRQACKLYDYALADIFTGDVRLRKITLGPNFDYLGGRASIPADRIAKLPTPDPIYIPGADGLWYDASGTAYTPEDAVKNVPNTYYASLELARKEPAILENGFMIDIGEGIRNRSGSPVRHRPSEMKAAIEAIPGSSKPEQEKSITIQKNGSYNVIPDSGNTMSKVIVTAQVPGQKPETAGSEIITSNGVHSFSPPAGGVFSNFTADVQIAQPATQEKTVEITTNGTTPVTPDLGKLLSKVIVKTNVSTGGGSVGGGNISSGRILLDSDLVISISSPLVVNHNLGVIPNVFVLFSEYEFRKGEPKHVFFSIVANDTDSGCSIKASYFSGQYPELYLYNGSNGKLSAQSHPNGKSFLDVFGATETQIKIGAYKDVSAAIQGSTKYIWIAAKI